MSPTSLICLLFALVTVVPPVFGTLLFNILPTENADVVQVEASGTNIAISSINLSIINGRTFRFNTALFDKISTGLATPYLLNDGVITVTNLTRGGTTTVNYVTFGDDRTFQDPAGTFDTFGFDVTNDLMVLVGDNLAIGGTAFFKLQVSDVDYATTFGNPGTYSSTNTQAPLSNIEVNVAATPCGTILTGPSTARWGDYGWIEGINYFYDGYYPFVYLFDYAGWIYIFGCDNKGDTDEAGYYLYDFNKSQFGFTQSANYPYYFPLPSGDPVKLGL